MNSTDMSGDLILENINTGVKFILRHNESMYRCGRKRTNEIITDSILASREHCIFLRAQRQLHVIDHGSANGIYINGVLQQPNFMVTLKINDIIGLGSPRTASDPIVDSTTPTIYVLKSLEPEPQTCADAANAEPDLPQQPVDNITSNASENRKRLSKDSHECDVPCKVPRVEDTMPIPNVEKKTIEVGAPADSSVFSKKFNDEKFRIQLPDIIDITDENSSDYEMKGAVMNECSNAEGNVKITEKSVVSPCILHKSVDSNNISRSTKIDTDEITDHCDVSSTTHSRLDKEKSTERKKNQCGSKAIIIANPLSTMEKDQVQSSPKINKITTDGDVLLNRPESKSSREGGYSVISSSRHNKNVINVDTISKKNDQTSSDDEEIVRYTKASEKRDDGKYTRDSDNDEFKDFLVPALNLEDVNLHERMQCRTEQLERGNDNSGIFLRSNDNGIVQEIKYEPEITIIDDDESVYINAKPSSPEIPMPTPLKLKYIKQETKTRYSEVDVVTLSDDDEDDFYPASQLFGDEPEGHVKTEPSNNEIEESEAESFHNEINDDPDIILMDSDSEDDGLYNRVMQSSLNESREVHVKRENEEQEPIIEDCNADEFGNLNEQEEIYKLCFPDDKNDTDESVSHVDKRKKKEKRSQSVEKLESTRLKLLDELKEWDELERGRLITERKSGKLVEKSTKKGVADEDSDKNEERASTSSKAAGIFEKTEKDSRKKSIRGKKRSTSVNSELKDATSREEDQKEKDKNPVKKPSSLDGTRSARVSNDAIHETDSESGKSNEKNSEKPPKHCRISTEKSRSISNNDHRSLSSEKSTSISTKKSKSITKEKSRSTCIDESDKLAKSVYREKSRSTSTERSRSISVERSSSSSTEKQRSIPKEDSRSTTGENVQTRKSLQIVDAPFLANGHGRGVSCDVKRMERSMNVDESTSNTSPQINGDRDITPSREKVTRLSTKKSTTEEYGEKLTTKQKKELALKEKQDKFFKMKDQKIRRMKNKWAECLPPRTHQGPSLSRKEREEIKNDRKEKLKKIADDNKKIAEDNESAGMKRPIKKVIAKVTEKTRSDFLVNEMKDRIDKQSAGPECTNVENDARSPETSDKHRDRSSNDISNKHINNENTSRVNGDESTNVKNCTNKSLDVIADSVPSAKPSKKSYDKSLKITKKGDASLDLENVNPFIGEANGNDGNSKINKVSQRFKTALIIEPRSQEPGRHKTKEKLNAKSTTVASASGDAKSLAGNFLTDVTSVSNKSRDPRIKVASSAKSLIQKSPTDVTATEAHQSKVIKRVSFNDLMNRVEVFEIEPGNTMKKCPSTDAPIQTKVISQRRKLDRAACPKLEQFLLRIFSWNPSWLQEQKKFDIPPPIVDTATLIPILSKYTNYEDYYKIMEPLLALELWYLITRELDIADKKSTRTSIMSSIVNNSMILTTVPSTNIRYTTLILEVVVSKRELASQTCPVYGDLIFFEYMTNAKGKKAFCTVFAYVEKIREAVITPFTHYNRELLHHVKDPYAVLSYSVITKPLDHTNIQTNRIYRLRRVSYLRSNIRMIQSLQYLPVSPLLNQILHPEIGDYELPPMQNDESYSLTTKDNLNTKQLEAVVRVTEAVVRKLPKICLIQGPPGTGKSKVIVNLVTEILYGKGRYRQNKKMRILVCAPSNAAIDEIVSRLLEVRQSLPDGTSRFKMVRIGRVETMHPVAKSISLTVLAKKDVRTTTENYMSPAFTIDSVEEEKRLLTAKINSQQLELTAAQSRNAPDMYYLAKTLCESRSRLDLLTNRRPLERIDPKALAKLERGAEATLLMGADVITCTLTSCYTSLMESIFGEGGHEISVCIVDEATQCAEAETLIPLMLGVRTLVLVGDTNQLPATIISQKAKEYGLDQSLFARIQSAFKGKENNPIIQLNTQYRMSWPVAFWPNRFFYGGALKNAAKLYNLPFHFYKVIDLDSTQNNDKFSNTDEATFVANLFQTIMTYSKLEKANLPVRVGVITPYNNQKVLIKNKIRECTISLSDSVKKKFVHEVNTVDSFQGQERDVIIMSCVRSSGIGFLSDRQRLCVALTRAKHSLILCGNFKTFERDPMWNALLSDAKSRGVYTRIKASASLDDIKPHVIK